MNTKDRQARARVKAKRNRMQRWKHGEAKNPKRAKARGARVIARGAGSINAEADMRQLVMAGQDAEAAALWELHHSIRGATRMTWGRSWYAQHKAMRAAA